MTQDQPNLDSNVPAVSEPTSSKDSPKFEESMNNLQQIVNRLNQQDLSLDEALELYERGVHLARHSRDLLNQAENRVAHLRQSLGDSNETNPQGGN